MHLCMASSIRAMPEKEKPPAMRVDLYLFSISAVLCKATNVLKINYSREYTEKNVRGDFMGNETLGKRMFALNLQ